MISRFRLFGALGVYWLTYMLVIRLVFLVYNHDSTAALTITEIGQIFVNGLRMDMSLAAYYLLLYGIILVLSIVVPGGWVSRAVKGYTVFLVVISGLISVVDLELYRHWGFRLNNTPFFYFGSGAVGSISGWVLIKGILIFVSLGMLSAFMFGKFISGYLVAAWKPVAKRNSAVMLSLTGLLFIPIRGSFTVAPMNVGFVYFHGSKPFANHAAVNVIWNFLSSLTKSAVMHYPEDFADPEEAVLRVDQLYPVTKNTPRLSKIEKPNIVLIVLEGFTSDIIHPLGGLDSITPNLNRLSGEGLLFTNFYASGDRTDKGLVSILSAYPAQPQTSIVKFPAKTERLPSLAGALKRSGYQTSFLYGGDVNFANFRSYITNMGFENTTDVRAFPDELNTSKWGVHDQYVFEKAKAEIGKTSSPFFKVILTLSSHEPFDVPMKPFLSGRSEEELYLNSCHYTDFWLGDFVEHSKKQSWWDSTLVVITADHGHRHPNNKKLEDERRFRIPLLITGGALALAPEHIDILGGQTDIANTLIAQIDGYDEGFRFSKDLLNPASVPFAAYFFQNGYGFLFPDRHLVYDHTGKNFLINVGCDSTDISISKAYQQLLFSDYNRR